jgi:glycerol-3-phosphate dehydrogenase
MSGEIDLLVIGGGINGAGIARDAAGRGLRVTLVERDDLGSATSSASSKLVHGGLRYLEQFELRLVAEALAEREVLLRAAPHLVRPMRFVMPRAPGLRPGWMIRAGLLLYDCMAHRDTLPPSDTIRLRGVGLKAEFDLGYRYADCWVDDARLVIATALGAEERGATIMPRTAFSSAIRQRDRWRATLRTPAGAVDDSARAIVNAAGPWVLDVLKLAHEPERTRVRLVQGSHIVVPRLYECDHAYILQNEDRRVIFAYPYEGEYTLIGTTEVELPPDVQTGSVTAQEVEYLCRAANRYFVRQIEPADVIWSYCGVRALVDDGARNPSAVTRDYRLQLDASYSDAPLLTVFGGKITTYRRLAERALERLAPYFPSMGKAWTATAQLPGGSFPGGSLDALTGTLTARYPDLPRELLANLAARHGTRTTDVLGSAHTVQDLGVRFGMHLYGREVDYFVGREWARNAEDVLWRRTKMGLHLTPEQRGRVESYVRNPDAYA